MKSGFFLYKPEGFNIQVEVSTCYCLHEGRFLLIQRHPSKHEGNRWCLPGGKLEKNEDPQMGARRELLEETGIEVPIKDLHFLQTFFIKKEESSFACHSFFLFLKEKPPLSLQQDEAIAASWVTLEEAKKLPLIRIGGLELLFHIEEGLKKAQII